MSLTFSLTRNVAPASAERIAEIHADPGFGVYFTDHMAVATWRQGSGWADDAVVPYGPFQLDPSTAVLHYAQEVFEGLKAYRHADGSIWLFRPERNAERLMASARRLMLPELPVDDFLTSIEQLVKVDAAWVPDAGGGEASLYLRPFMFANESFLGVRAAQRVTYAVIASPVGPYFSGGVQPVNIWVTDQYSRAGKGGTGAAKCGGNYASSLIAQYEGVDHGCSQVLFADAGTGVNAEELGGMNLMVVTADGQLITPELSGTILAGVTRDSILTVAADLGLNPVARPITLAEIFDRIDSGDIVEAFACGTAAVLTPVAAFRSHQGNHVIGDQPGERTMQIRSAILDVQYGRAEDSHGWLRRVV
ncbi:branched-chain amino acid aminotransferase [Micropruina sp.]|uniref:branched-chain amino acid aminotransferase n=1 Tax=Micropruina sp. TaxID=2737536 RepID=UPI0039E3B65C